MPATLSDPPTATAGRASRAELLAIVLDPARLPTPPAVALQVVNTASRPDCDPGEIVAFLSLDAALCGKLLKAVNSCLYGLKQPVASVGRAVQVIGLKMVRSLALGLSLPAVKVGRGTEQGMRGYWLSSVGGAIIARELAVLVRRPNPDDDLVAGLLRDLGEVLLRQAFPAEWSAHVARHAGRLVDDPCGAELESFGIDHADVTAELLRGWKLPNDLVAPIRHHHRPALLAANKAHADRGELLQFASYLVHVNAVAQRPELLSQVLTVARDRFGLSQTALVEFLQRVTPKIESFAAVLNQDIGQCPDFASILAAGATELVNLTVESNRERLSGTVRVPTPRKIAPPAPRTRPDLAADAPATVPGTRSKPPEFRPEFAYKLPEGGCRLGEYEVQSVLGRGSMGVVFKAHDPNLNRPVAVKILSPEVSVAASARERFAREARAAASIQHENVVSVYAVREATGTIYLVMEYVPGACLETRLRLHGRMPEALLVATARQIAAGLAAAHAKQIVHRDIKPANVLLEAETGRVKLTDFGLARVASDENHVTAAGTLIGTPFFMAPEVIRGEPATPLSDLFGLGGVLYEAATGQVPFPGQTVSAVFRAVRTAAPASLRSMRPDLPTWLTALVARLLEKDPARRYASASAVIAAIDDDRS
ncbi:protein kinase domain-containing protein [Frigoriglobus tundricola]|uniref:Uncharacterized protein n=1 Tax=Frigoriglobus tundricola TaxID=2774151 RepID=A0A6M5Z111_9BACT|nr:HDOD domain-containing protein [Frigoriglobus tundricola]QJW99091.1 hypothetical protein FTUN_6689 [Frigoriglobus tundricola]